MEQNIHNNQPEKLQKPDSVESIAAELGFVETEELRAIRLRSEKYLSDNKNYEYVIESLNYINHVEEMPSNEPDDKKRNKLEIAALLISASVYDDFGDTDTRSYNLNDAIESANLSGLTDIANRISAIMLADKNNPNKTPKKVL